MNIPIRWFIAALGMTGATAGAAAPALVTAAQNKDSKAVRALLSRHVDVNAAEPDGSTALHWRYCVTISKSMIC
jgi:hypothetical protein